MRKVREFSCATGRRSGPSRRPGSALPGAAAGAGVSGSRLPVSWRLGVATVSQPRREISGCDTFTEHEVFDALLVSQPILAQPWSRAWAAAA